MKKIFNFKSFTPDNASGMDRKRTGNGSALPRYLFTLLFALFLCAGQIWGNETFTAGTDKSDDTSIEKGCVTISFTDGTFSRDDNYRCYANKSMTIESAHSITKIEITCTANGTSNYGPGKFSLKSGDSGSYSYASTSNIGTWTYNSGATSITLNASSQVRMTKIVVTYAVTAPTSVTKGTITTSSAGLTITDSKNTGSYEIYYSTNSGAPNANTTATTTVTTKTPTLTSLSDGTTYYVWVRSKCSDDSKSSWTALTGGSFSTPSAGPACADPVGPGKGSINGTSATLTFSESGNYEIYCSTSNTAPTGSASASGSVSGGTSVTVSNLAYGTTYYYWGRKVCGENSKSNWVAGSATTFTTTVPAPTGISAGSITMNGATFTITDDNNVNNYDIYYSTSNTAPTAGTAATTTSTSKTKAVSGLAAGTYYYWVRAKGPNAKSDWIGGSTFTTLTLSSISVSTAPTKTKYLVGDNFDPTALVITRKYSDNSTDTYSYAGHTAEFSFNPSTSLTAGTSKAITITYSGKTTTTNVDVYSVTVNTVDVDGNALDVSGVEAGCSGRTLSQSVGSTNYKFNSWQVVAGGVTVSNNAITGTPSGNVTINAKFHKPITVAWKVGDGNASGGTTEVKYGAKVTALPTNPADNTLAKCGTNVFKGWSKDEITETGHSAPSDLFTSTSDAGCAALTENTIYHAVFAKSENGTSTVTFNPADVTNTPETSSGSKIWIHTTSGVQMRLYGSSSRYTGGSPKTWTMSHSKGSYTVISAPTNITQITARSVYQYTSGNTTYTGWIKKATPGTLSPTSFTQADADNYVDQTISNINATSVTLQDNSSSAGDQARVMSLTVTYVTTNISDYMTGCCPAHNVNITAPTNGTVEANVTRACENVSVTLTITPNTGYQLSALMVGGNNVTASVSEGSYSFDMPDADVAVSATFAAKHHNVVFHKNDGSDATDTQDYAFGETKTLKANGWSRDDYNFGGWMNAANGESSDYADGASYTLSVDANVDLYALWIPDNTRSITYNGDAHISSYTAQPATVAEDAANIAITFALESNYELKSVAVTMGGAAIAADKIAFTQSSLTITAPASGFTDNISITYTIEEMKYTVHFSINGNVTDKEVVRGQTLNDIPTPAALTGFTFEGWASATLAETTTEPASYALSKTATSYTPSEDNVTFYAVYSRVEETELDGFKLSFTTSTPSTYYAGPMGTDSYFSQSNADNAEILFEEAAETAGQVYLYFYNGNNKTYIYTGIATSATISKTTSKASASPWTKGDEGDGKVSYTSTQNLRYIAYNVGSPRFAVYNSKDYDKALTPTAAKKTIEATFYSTTAVVPVLQSIAISHAPDKIAYFEGDDFEVAGMVVTGTYNTGDKVLKASQYTVTPSTNLEAGTTSVTIAAVEDNTKTASQSITVTAIELTSITVTAPTKTVYVVGQNFDPTGMVVTAHYNDSRKDKAVTGYTMTPSTSTALTAENDHIEISYTEGGVTKTANQAITVNAALTGIEITTNPDKMTYIETETFDATGMVVTAHYNGSSDQIVTASVTWDKTGVLAALNSLENPTVETITFTYEESGAEVTTTLNVTVNPYPRYTVTFSANGTPTNVTETAGQGGVTVPANPSAVGDYTFAGWSKSQRAVESADDPALVTITAGKYYPAGAETLYAVYTMNHETEVAGMLLSFDNSGTETYLGSYNTSGTKFNFTTTIGEALPLWYTDGYLFYMNGTTPTYVFNTKSGNADIEKSTTKHNTADWVRSEAEGKIMFQSTTNTTRYLCYSSQSSSFRSYAPSQYTTHQLTVTESSATATFEVPYYTTAPSADVTPTISFAETSKTITVVDENGALNTCTNALTTNSTGTVSYVSSNENIATVAANGTVSVKAVGEVTITANVAAVAGTWKAVSKSYTLTIEKATASASFGTPATTIVYKDNTIALPATSEQAITITYSSNDNTVATIDESGNVTGVATYYGNTNQRTVTVYANWAETDYYEASTNSTRGKITVTVKNNAKTQTLSFTDEAKDFGSDQGDKVYTNTLNGAKTSVTYASSNETVAEVDENTGEVTVHTNAAGSATITATAAAGNVIEDGIQYAYAQAQAMYVISIVYPRPTISVASCEFKAPFEVALSSEATNVEMIVYTTDGTDPSYAGNKGDIYTEPIAINATTTLKAIAVSDENEESPVATATYTKLVPEFTEWSFEDGESVAMNVEQTITASEGAVITYIISKGGVEVASATTESNVATFTLTEAGNYEVDAEAQWNVANGFVSESVSRTIHVKGAVHLPISYTGNGTGVASEPYFTTTGTALGNYGEANVNAPIKMSGTCSLTAEFLDEPSSVIFYVGKNSSGDLTSTLTVEESANGVDFEVVQAYDDNNLSTAVTSQMTSGYNGGGVKEKLTLKPTTRFVRWSFVKNNGNVGIGKIKIYQKEIVMDESSDVLPEDFSGDVIVPTGTSLYIIEDTELGNLTVEKGAEVDNLADLTVKDFFIEAQEGASGQILNPAELNVTGQAYYDLTLNTSGTMDNSKWYAFAVPFQVDAASGIQRLSNDGVTSPAQFNGHYVLLKYNSAAYASAGEGWEYMTAGETLMPGKFYMIALNSNAYNRVRMTKKAGAALNNKADLTLSLVGEGVHANWNALANNALAYVQVNAAGGNSGLKVQTYNSADNNYTAFDFNKVTLTVGTPFFIQAAVNNDPLIVSVATSTENTTVKAPQREAVATEEFQIRLGENTESYYDILYVSASEEALNEYQIGHDLAKAGVSKTVPQMYVPAYGAKLCDAEFPLENNEATFPLTFTAPNAGTYQLYVAEAAQDAELYLMQNNSIVWNLTLSPYEIALPQGTTEGYSLLLKAKAPSVVTGVDQIDTKVGAQKVIIDEHVYILRGGQMYDVNGKMVK